MYSLEEFYSITEREAPIKYSNMMIAKGEYDNSGILIKMHDKVERVLFSLDLSESSVLNAKKFKCDTIVTHHPAIYTPLKRVENDSLSKPVMLAVKNNLNVISMHLNLDLCVGGIDENLGKAFGGENQKIIDVLENSVGYGREFNVKDKTLLDMKKLAKTVLNSNRVISYGKENEKINKAVSFCGAGSSFAINYVDQNMTDADLIITSDMPHHVIKALVEENKKILLITHYSAENYGFNKFYEKIKNKTAGKTECVFYADKRFM